MTGVQTCALPICRRRPAGPRGEVQIENPFGAITVHGWDKNEVLVQGTVAAGAESFDFDSDKEGTSISVSVPDAWFQAAGEEPSFRSTLNIWLPAGSGLSIQAVNAAVVIEGVSGTVDVDTVNGAVKITGARAELQVETMTGGIGRASCRERVSSVV